jgi:hypothetical protein
MEKWVKGLYVYSLAFKNMGVTIGHLSICKHNKRVFFSISPTQDGNIQKFIDEL